MEEIIRIPDERIGALIGPKGTVKRMIEKKTGAFLEIDSGSGEVVVTGEGEGYFKAADVVKAIARGFSPERAYTLFKDDYLLKLIEIVEFVGKSESNLKAKRGRVIGRAGLARKAIEKKTRSLVSVYGKTVGIIAMPEDMQRAVEAVEMLLEGAKHESMDMVLSRKKQGRFEL
jgi:ribosomal RNA assembly protein